MVKELVARHLIAIETLMSSQGSNIPLSSPIGSNPNNPRQHHASPSLPNSLSLIPLHITATQLKQIQQGLHLLTAESEKLWLEQCEVICKAHWQKSFPLHKVWKTRGSGKTEVFPRLIECNQTPPSAWKGFFLPLIISILQVN